jgi:hypothetical protein
LCKKSKLKKNKKKNKKIFHLINSIALSAKINFIKQYLSFISNKLNN